MKAIRTPKEVGDGPGRGPIWPRLYVVGCALAFLLALILHRVATTPSKFASGYNPGHTAAKSERSDDGVKTGPKRVLPKGFGGGQPAPTPQEIVTKKLSQFGHSRRELACEIARKRGIQIPDSVEKFFDAVEGGNLDDIFARFNAISGSDGSASSGSRGRPPGIQPIWPAIIEAEGAAEAVRDWPAQKLLDYGNAVLGSLTPGMVYVGGTDPGRFIPTMMNATSEGEQHIIITQNGLADGTYLDYLNFLYADQMKTPSTEDSQRAFQDYLADAQKRAEHDQQFPDEPKQIRPGEDVHVSDGKTTVSGQIAVMGINELILQSILKNNPGMTFGLEESFPMKSTYADATMLGPIMQLRASDRSAALTPEVAAQSVDYWRNEVQQLAGDPEATDDSAARKTYSKMAASQANLLAAHHYTDQAEQAYRVAMEIMPGNPEATYGLAQLLGNAGHVAEAQKLIADFQQNYPQNSANPNPAWKATITSGAGRK